MQQLQVTSGDSLLMADDSDADDDDAFTVTQIAVTGGSNNAVTAGIVLIILVHQTVNRNLWYTY